MELEIAGSDEVAVRNWWYKDAAPVRCNPRKTMQKVSRGVRAADMGVAYAVGAKCSMCDNGGGTLQCNLEREPVVVR